MSRRKSFLPRRRLETSRFGLQRRRRGTERDWPMAINICRSRIRSIRFGLNIPLPMTRNSFRDAVVHLAFGVSVGVLLGILFLFDGDNDVSKNIVLFNHGEHFGLIRSNIMISRRKHREVRKIRSPMRYHISQILGCKFFLSKILYFCKLDLEYQSKACSLETLKSIFQKADKVISALHEGYTKLCKETIYFTNNEKIYNTFHSRRIVPRCHLLQPFQRTTRWCS